MMMVEDGRMEDVLQRRCGIDGSKHQGICTLGAAGFLCQVDVSCAGTLTLCWSWFGRLMRLVIINIIDKIVKGQVVCHGFEVRSLRAEV
jgi:hypothetical protein